MATRDRRATALLTTLEADVERLEFDHALRVYSDLLAHLGISPEASVLAHSGWHRLADSRPLATALYARFLRAHRPNLDPRLRVLSFVPHDLLRTDVFPLMDEFCLDQSVQFANRSSGGRLIGPFLMELRRRIGELIPIENDAKLRQLQKLLDSRSWAKQVEAAWAEATKEDH